MEQPERVDGLPVKAVVSEVTGGGGHSVAVLSDGTAYAWGDAT